MNDAVQKLPDDVPVMVAWKAWRESVDGVDAIAALSNPAEVGHIFLAFFAGWDAAKAPRP